MNHDVTLALEALLTLIDSTFFDSPEGFLGYAEAGDITSTHVAAESL